MPRLSQEVRATRKIILAAQPGLRKAFVRAVTTVRNGTSITDVEDLLNAGNLDGAVNAIPWAELAEPVLRDQLMRGLRDVYEQTGAKMADIIDLGSEFSIVDPRASQWIGKYGADKVVEISDATVAGLRTSLVTMLDGGLTAQQAAQLIRPQIGLHERWAQAVSTYAVETEAAGELTGEELTADVQRYATQLLQARAMNIARTESQYAAQAGQREAWDQAAEQGLFDKAVATKTWLYDFNSTTDCGCPELDGETVGYDELFSGGDDAPPRHTNCGCSLVLHPEGAAKEEAA